MENISKPRDSSLVVESKVRTPAYASFDSNTDKLVHLFGFMTRGVLGYSHEVKTKIVREIRLLGSTQSNEASNQEVERAAMFADKARGIADGVLDLLGDLTTGLETIGSWVPVMLVTTVEAYLKDVLVYAANVCPEIMQASEQSATYGELTRVESLEEIIEELRSRWARNFVDDGGPDRWIKRLTNMGARGYRSTAASEMEPLWGVRHLVVHSAGVATPHFVRRHPEIGAKPGESIPQSSDQLKAWIDVVYHFVDITDSYFVQRCGLGK